MIVGATVLPCCCQEGDCGSLGHASAPDTLSVSAGWTSTVYFRNFGNPFGGGDPCNPDCPNYDPNNCCDFITELNISFQGVLNKSPASEWLQVNKTLYLNWVEFDWQITQTIVEGGCAQNGVDAHSESGSGTYDDPISWLPFVRLRCIQSPSQQSFLPLCADMQNNGQPGFPDGTFPNPNYIATVPCLMLEVFTEQSNSGVALDAPTRPEFPWQGLAIAWPNNRDWNTGFGGQQPLWYLHEQLSQPGFPQPPQYNDFRPSQFRFVGTGANLTGTYSPIVSSQHPMHDNLPSLLFDFQNGTAQDLIYNACEVTPIPGNPNLPCPGELPYRRTGNITGAYAIVG